MNWLLIFVAGVLEVIWASGLKHADSLLDWIGIACLITISFIMLIRAYRTIPVAAAYSVFVGIGTVGTYIVGAILGEEFSIGQVIFLGCLLFGILGLKMTTKEKTKEGDA